MKLLNKVICFLFKHQGVIIPYKILDYSFEKIQCRRCEHVLMTWPRPDLNRVEQYSHESLSKQLLGFDLL